MAIWFGLEWSAFGLFVLFGAMDDSMHIRPGDGIMIGSYGFIFFENCS